MIILGLDPGTATTGYGVIKKDRNELICLDFGCIKTLSGLEDATRLKQLRENLIKIFKQHNPDSSAVEQLFFAKNVKTALSVAHARGVTLETLASCGIPVYEYTPIQIKQAVTGYGRAEKIQVQKMVQAILQLKKIPSPDDAADALATAICCAHTYAPTN